MEIIAKASARLWNNMARQPYLKEFTYRNYNLRFGSKERGESLLNLKIV
jgi:hypothetical protein